MTQGSVPKGEGYVVAGRVETSGYQLGWELVDPRRQVPTVISSAISSSATISQSEVSELCDSSASDNDNAFA